MNLEFRGRVQVVNINLGAKDLLDDISSHEMGRDPPERFKVDEKDSDLVLFSDRNMKDRE